MNLPAHQLPLELSNNDNHNFEPLQATFQGSKEESFRRWYPYLEGYSHEFVDNVLRHFAPNAQVILDPFGGTATTAFLSAEKGLRAFTCEVNPVMQFIFEVKTTILLMDTSDRQKLYVKLLDIYANLPKLVSESIPNSKLAKDYSAAFGDSVFFDSDTFQHVLKTRTLVDEIGAGHQLLADLLTIAILANLISCSRLKRSGDVRYKTQEELSKGVPNFLMEVGKKLMEIAEDTNLSEEVLKTRPLLICEDTRNLETIPHLGVDTVITSPPYINGTNYFRNTKVELWFLGCLTSKGDLSVYRRKAITAGINDVTVGKSSTSTHPHVKRVVRELEKNAYDSRIPRMVASYFSEMTDVFDSIRKHLVNGATIAIDIGDSNYGGVLVAADELLVDCLRPLGYSLREVIHLRERRSKNGAALKQVLLVFDYQQTLEAPSDAPQEKQYWHQEWEIFKNTLPHQVVPYSQRNWGNDLHSLCSYQGKLKPAIAHYLVKTFVPEGGAVLDPFAGVGTIPFEAALQGKKSFGFDLSLAAYIISNAKLNIVEAQGAISVVQELQRYIANYKPTLDETEETKTFGFNKKIVDYYHPETLREILAAKTFFQNHPITPATLLVQSCCLHILHGNRPYALSRRSHPITPYAPSGEFTYRDLISRLTNKVEKSLSTPIPKHFVSGQIYHQDATKWWPLEVENLDAVITSPPFFDSTRFYLANWIRLWFTGWKQPDFDEKPLAFIDERQKQTFAVYESILRQTRERLKPDGVLVLHLGKSKKCDMAKELIKISKQWFSHYDVFDESVAHTESHGIRDKGTVTDHQYLVLY